MRPFAESFVEMRGKDRIKRSVLKRTITRRRKASVPKGKWTAKQASVIARERSISPRPKEVHSRESFGHGKLDTLISGRRKSKGCVMLE